MVKKNSIPCEWKILRNPRQSIIRSNHGNMTFSLANSVKQVQERQTKHDGEAPSPSPKSNRLNMWSRAGVSCLYVLYVYTALTVPVDIRSSTVSPSLLRLRQGLSPHIRHRCVLKSQHGANISGGLFNMQKGTLWESKHWESLEIYLQMKQDFRPKLKPRNGGLLPVFRDWIF